MGFEDRRHAIINQLSGRCIWSAHLEGRGGNGRISNGRGSLIRRVDVGNGGGETSIEP